MNAAQGTAFYDIQGLAALRAEASSTPTNAIEEVASQFESLFTQMMLKSMREATIKGGLFESDQMDFYQGMFDQQLSLQLSRESSLGLADILVEQLDGGAQPAAARVEQAQDITRLDALLGRTRSPDAAAPVAGGRLSVSAVGAGAANEELTVAAGSESQDWAPGSPEEFIRSVWQHAVSAAGKIGVDPLVLVAQSALETGWGKKVIQAADGSSSFNLFGIKAGASWEGPSAAVNTLEFNDGVAALERASFRVYDSLQSSFDDYVALLTSSPRYQQALDKADDARAFVQELQGAGYATDPRYAQKIISILDTPAYSSIFDELKNFASLPLTAGNG